MQTLALLLTLVVAGQGGADERLTQARQAEERAFAAIDDKRWCDATWAFLEANQLAPSVDLTFNAAQAAALAGDRKRAMKLYADLLDAYPDSKQQEAVNQALAELTRKIQTDGPGTPCAEPEPAAPQEPVTDAPDAEQAAAPAPVEVAPATAAPPVWPWAMAGGGALLAVGGGAMIGTGLVPWFSYTSAIEQIRAVEEQRGDASALQKQQAEARAAWEGWGELTVWSGVATATVGVLVAATGIVLGVVSTSEPSELDAAPASEAATAEIPAPVR